MKRPLPFRTEFEDAPFWDYCSKDELRIQRCSVCERFWWPIGPACPICLAEDYEWRRVAGVGTVSNYVVYHKVYYPEFKDSIPYLVAEIELPEGVRLIGNVKGLEPGAPKPEIIGAKVNVFFEDCDGVLKIPQWCVTRCVTPLVGGGHGASGAGEAS
jgi:hypothetical protein